MSLRLKLLIPLVVMTLLFTALMHQRWLPDFVAHSTEEILIEHEQLLKVLGIAVQEKLHKNDMTSLYTTIERVRSANQPWVSLMVLSTTGDLLYPAAYPSHPLPHYHTLKHTITTNKLVDYKLLLQLDLTKRLEDEIGFFYQIEFAVIVVVSLLLAFYVLIQERLIIAPISRITDASKKISTGDYSLILPETANMEFRELYHAFEHMKGALKNREENLEKSEKLLHKIISNISVGVVCADAENRVFSVNKHAETLLNSTEEELVHSKITDTLTTNKRSEYSIEHVLSCDKDERTNVLCSATKNPSVLLEARVDRISRNDVIRKILIIDDVSARVRHIDNMKSESEINAAINDMSLVMQKRYIPISLRIEHAIKILMGAIPSSTGLIIATHKNNPSSPVVMHRCGDTSNLFIDESTLDEITHLTEKTLEKDGGKSSECIIPINNVIGLLNEAGSAHSTPLLDGRNIIGNIIIISNRSTGKSPQERKLLVMSSKVISLSLLEENAHNTLHEANKKAEKYMRAKSEFITNMSHEIRTPINGIIGSLELLNESGIPDAKKQYIDIALRSSDNLLSLVNDILDISRIDTDKSALISEEFNLINTIERTIESYSDKCKDKGIRLKWSYNKHTPSHVVGDRARIKQAVAGILDNAYKFTSSGEITVDITCDSVINNCISTHITVSDTGCGIAHDKQQEIFELFTQQDGSDSRKHQGCGIGLPICKKIAKLMGGEILVKSTQGVGSEFTFSINLEQSKLPVHDEKARGLSGKNIVVLSNDETNKRLLSETLTRWGCRIQSKTYASLESLQRNSADLILLDNNSLDINDDNLDKLCAYSVEMKMPLLVISESMTDGIHKHILRQSINAHTCTPIVRNTLKELLLGVIGKSNGSDTEYVPLHAHEPLNGKVMVVDDNQVNRIIASSMLKQMGLSVDEARDGYEAVELSSKIAYDIIFMDIQMPIMNGYEATKQIRSGSLNNTTKIIAVTANTMNNDRDKCLNAGMDEYIAKPYQLSTLRDTTEHALVSKQNKDTDNNIIIDKESIDLQKFESLKTIIGIDAIHEILKSFKYDGLKQIRQMRDAYAAGDMDALKRTAHTLKGTSGNLGAKILHSLCSNLEMEAKEGSVRSGEQKIENIEHEYGQVCSDFSEIVAKKSA